MANGAERMTTMTDSRALAAIGEALHASAPKPGNWRDELQDAYAHIAARLREPAGVGGEWVLVPRKLTPEMRQAMSDCYDPTWGYGSADVGLTWAERSHAAMLAAAPQPPAEAQAQGGGEVDRWEVPPCVECGAVDAKDAETKCICAGDKDDCHGCHLWPDDDTAPPSTPKAQDGGEVVEKPCKRCGALVFVWAHHDDTCCIDCTAPPSAPVGTRCNRPNVACVWPECGRDCRHFAQQSSTSTVRDAIHGTVEVTKVLSGDEVVQAQGGGESRHDVEDLLGQVALLAERINYSAGHDEAVTLSAELRQLVKKALSIRNGLPLLRTAPPSAPVEVEKLARRIEGYHWDIADKPVAARFAAQLRALAQQPATVNDAWVRRLEGLARRWDESASNDKREGRRSAKRKCAADLRALTATLAAQPGGKQ